MKNISLKSWKELGGIAFCAAVALTMLPSASHAQGRGQNKVTICHKGHTIEVAEPAVQAHLNHGDTLGPCEVTPSNNR